MKRRNSSGPSAPTSESFASKAATVRRRWRVFATVEMTRRMTFQLPEGHALLGDHRGGRTLPGPERPLRQRRRIVPSAVAENHPGSWTPQGGPERPVIDQSGRGDFRFDLTVIAGGLAR